MREAFGAALLELGEEMPNLVVLGADTTESLQSHHFGKKYPERFFNVGIAEQNLVGVSAGLALYGKTAVCGTYMVFLERAIDQIRNTIGYCNLDVKLVGSHVGISVGQDGGSHQTIEDISIMRAIPNFRVVAPADTYSAKMLIKEAVRTRGPMYIRLIRPSSPAIYEEGRQLKIGRAEVIRDGHEVTIVANGILVKEAMNAAAKLAERSISAEVIDCHTIKPLDEDTILDSVRKTGRVVTVEDHNVHGGLGSAVAEAVSKNYPVKMGMVGVRDRFGESGDCPELLAKYGLGEVAIFEEAIKMARS